MFCPVAPPTTDLTNHGVRSVFGIRVASYQCAAATNVSDRKCLMSLNLKGLVMVPNNVRTKIETKQGNISEMPLKDGGREKLKVANFSWTGNIHLGFAN